MKILLIEDDLESASHVIAALSRGGHQVDHATSGRAGLELAIDGSFDVAIVDRMVPGIDGLSLVRMIRAAQVSTRVIFVTTMAGIDDRVDGFEAGGDDYLIKPFAMPELLARVAALTKRNESKRDETVLSIGDLEFNLVRRQVKRGGRLLDLQGVRLRGRIRPQLCVNAVLEGQRTKVWGTMRGTVEQQDPRSPVFMRLARSSSIPAGPPKTRESLRFKLSAIDQLGR